MLAVLSGGTGTPKLLQGLTKVLPPEEISVVVNTAEDAWLPHGYFSPDIDTVLYTLSGLIDEETWHGIKGDTYTTHRRLLKLGSREVLRIGDLDRATHIWRGELMTGGMPLSKAVSALAESLGVRSRVYPMSDDAVETVILTPQGELGFHEFWVENHGKPEVRGVIFKGIENARGCRGAVKALREADGVIIGPSNPVSSILPILSVKELRESLETRENRVAVSPMIKDRPVSGPADKFLLAIGREPSSGSVAAMYTGLIDYFIVDHEDHMHIRGAKVRRTETLMQNLEDKRRLAEFTLEVLGLF